MENISSLKHGFQSPFNMGRPFKVGMEEKLSWRETFCTLMPPPYMFASTKASMYTQKKTQKYKIQNAWKIMLSTYSWVDHQQQQGSWERITRDFHSTSSYLYLCIFVFVQWSICDRISISYLILYFSEKKLFLTASTEWSPLYCLPRYICFFLYLCINFFVFVAVFCLCICIFEYF